MKIFEKNGKLQFFPKVQILCKNRNFVQKSKFGPKINCFGTLSKTRRAIPTIITIAKFI